MEYQKEIEMNRIADLHMHIVPGVDDGSRTIEESIEMLEMAKSQGVTDVFCTSHNGYCEEDGEIYITSFNALTKAVEEANIGVRLHMGCEVLCAGDYIDDIIYGLDIGVFQTLGNSKYVLTELYSDTKPSEALLIIKTLKEHGSTVAMTGDGVNDAPALTLSDVGISMGLMGSQATIESSDVVIADDNIAKVPELIKISKYTKKIVLQNSEFFIISSGKNLLH